MFTRAIVRAPASNFADGLTTVQLGVPHFDQVLAQHAHYCEALTECGLNVTTLDADPRHPDSTFVKDTAVLTPRVAILMRPAAASRLGEVDAILPVIHSFFQPRYPLTFPVRSTVAISAKPEAISSSAFRIAQMRRAPASSPPTLPEPATHASTINIRAMNNILHLKSGISSIGDNTLVVMKEMAENPQFHGFNLIRVSAQRAMRPIAYASTTEYSSLQAIPAFALS